MWSTRSRLLSEIPVVLEGKKILLVNHGDIIGDSAVVTFRLMQALRREGVDARMLVYTKSSSESNVQVIGSRLSRGVRYCLERLHILANSGYDTKSMFAVSTGRFAIDISSHPWVRESDVVCLGWINQGLMSLDGIRKLGQSGKKLVWLVHDTWPFTGICHHSGVCTYFTDQCGNCMYLRDGGHSHDLSRTFWKRKRDLYKDVDITFITESRWLERNARSSSLLRGMRVMTIPPPFPAEYYYVNPPKHIDTLLSGSKPNLILIGSNVLDDESKQPQVAIAALNHIFDNYPEVASRTAVYLFGALRNPGILDGLRMSHRWFGRINDHKILRYLMSSAKVMLSTSQLEHIPTTLIEGMAAGAVPVTFNSYGRDELIAHRETGYLAQPGDALDLAEGLLWGLSADVDRQMLHDLIAERYSSETVAGRFIELFDSLLKE